MKDGKPEVWALKRSVETLLSGVVDYAGLFPPAGLDMESSIRNYATYRSGPHSWALGRFIAPVSRLEDFNFHIAGHAGESRRGRGERGEWEGRGELVEREGRGERREPRGSGRRGEPWRLSALADVDLHTDLERIKRFNRWHAERDETLEVVIDALEIKAGSPAAIAEKSEVSPDSLRVFFEVPIDGDPDELVAAIYRAGGAAKVRTGGVTPDLVPPVEALTRFLDACLRSGVPFKATGGLHHPFRGVRAPAHERAGSKGVGHGFLNLLLCAAFMYDGVTAGEAAAVVTEESAAAFLFDDTGVEWRGHRVTTETLAIVRRDFAVSFGSSSFEEPMAELRRLNLS